MIIKESLQAAARAAEDGMQIYRCGEDGPYVAVENEVELPHEEDAVVGWSFLGYTEDVREELAYEDMPVKDRVSMWYDKDVR